MAEPRGIKNSLSRARTDDLTHGQSRKSHATENRIPSFRTFHLVTDIRDAIDLTFRRSRRRAKQDRSEIFAFSRAARGKEKGSVGLN